MKKPLIKNYCKPFILDPENKDLVSFDSKSYAKEAKKYIEYQEKRIAILEQSINKFIDGSTKDNGLFANHIPFFINNFKQALES